MDDNDEFQIQSNNYLCGEVRGEQDRREAHTGLRLRL